MILKNLIERNWKKTNVSESVSITKMLACKGKPEKVEKKWIWTFKNYASQKDFPVTSKSACIKWLYI